MELDRMGAEPLFHAVRHYDRQGCRWDSGPSLPAA